MWQILMSVNCKLNLLIILPSVLNFGNVMHIADVLSTFWHYTLFDESSRTTTFIIMYNTCHFSNTRKNIQWVKTFKNLFAFRLTHLLLIHLNWNIFNEILLDDVLKEFISWTVERKCIIRNILIVEFKFYSLLFVFYVYVYIIKIGT